MLECGVDEVGLGAAAFEVYSAAVILDPKRPISGLADSKKLSPRRRETLSVEIKEKAIAWCIASATLEEIEQLNVLAASHLAMRRAIEGLQVQPGMALVDGNRVPDLPVPARAIVKGDATVAVISAASIIAKVARDAAMQDVHTQWPMYGFDAHKGYLTAAHLAALQQYGPCPVHRRTYAPIRALLEAGRFLRA